MPGGTVQKNTVKCPQKFPYLREWVTNNTWYCYGNGDGNETGEGGLCKMKNSDGSPPTGSWGTNQSFGFCDKNGGEVCRATNYTKDKRCYCSSPKYVNLDGRYKEGDPKRYAPTSKAAESDAGGWALSNNSVGVRDCQKLCATQPECKEYDVYAKGSEPDIPWSSIGCPTKFPYLRSFEANDTWYCYENPDGNKTGDGGLCKYQAKDGAPPSGTWGTNQSFGFCDNNGGEVCRATNYTTDKRCYCSTPKYVNLDGRYKEGDPKRYASTSQAGIANAGGWALSNGSTGVESCRKLCESQPECKGYDILAKGWEPSVSWS